MSSLGIRQGSIIVFSGDLTDKSSGFLSIAQTIQSGRYGLFKGKGVTRTNLFVVLTQDCSISSGKHIELAQLKVKNSINKEKTEHIFLGKDYNKLYLDFADQVLEAEETLLTKITRQNLENFLNAGDLDVKGILSKNSTRIILDWRTLAYFREPYPHNFNVALVSYLNGEGQWFLEFLSEYNKHIHSIRIFVTPEDEHSTEGYQFSLTALLLDEGEEEENHIGEMIEKMLGEFDASSSDVDCIQLSSFDAGSIEFPKHLVLAYTAALDDFSFANAGIMREYNFQYVCYE